jgi:acyl-CoA synthetase (AMP-forming)/AMP-acid ligase II
VDISSLTHWIESPDADRGIHFVQSRTTSELWSYARLADLCCKVAAGLAAEGVRRGDVVVIAQRSGPGFVAGLFGSLLLGATPSPVAAPMVFRTEAAERHIGAVVAAARPALVIADAWLAGAPTVLERQGCACRVFTVEALVVSGDEAGGSPPRRDARYALLQFTSGSTGQPRGICITLDALLANVRGIRDWLRWGAQDRVATWLPVHHDMGLIGTLITPVVSQTSIWSMKPDQFLRWPERYLQGLSEWGATLTAMPPFGLDHVVRHIDQYIESELRLGHVRAVIVGAERIGRSSLERFHEMLGPRGLRRDALLPAYGLAESSLAVTGLRPGVGWSGLDCDVGALSTGKSVLERPLPGARGSNAFVVGCGTPVLGTTVTIVDEGGVPVPEGQVGEIVVEGPSLAEKYWNECDGASLTRLSDGRLKSGDAGFLVKDQLFVVGRIGDSIKIRGRMTFAEDLELNLAAAGVARQSVAVLLGHHRGRANAVAMVERAAPELVQRVRELLGLWTEGAAVTVLSAPRGTIPRTTSGKPKRRQLWAAFTEGALPSAHQSGPETTVDA